MEDFLGSYGGVLLADDMGLGKTLQALWLLKRSKVGDMFPALVVCPASVKYLWEHEALMHVGIRAQVLEGRTPPKRGTMGLLPRLQIINPDILKAWLPYLLKIGLRTIILDECQFFTNLNATRTRAAIELSYEVPYRIALSGTPISNRPSELYPALHILRPEEFPAFFPYAQRFCDLKRHHGKWIHKGATNIPELHRLLKRTCMIRRLKEDVLENLPEKMRRVVPLDISDRDEYQHARDHFSSWMRKNFQHSKVTAALRAVAMTQIGYLLRLSAKLKCRNVVKWANDFLEAYPDEKLVLFAVHHRMIEVLQRRVHSKHVTIDGSVSTKRRKLAIATFKNDPACRVFIGNLQAAGVGIDGLQKVCNNMAMTEIAWRPGDHTQAEDRLFRIGQNKPVFINYLVAGDTIEERLCEVIQHKQRVIRETLDGVQHEGDLTVFDQLLKEISKK